MNAKPSIRDEWDFYPCHVDDAPASMFLNLGFVDALPPHATPVLHWVGLEMLHPGDHGMGVSPDVDSLFDAEDSVVKALGALGLVFVARLRNNGEWQLNFYGTAVEEAHVLETLRNALGEQTRGFRFGRQEDPEGECYTDFFYPPPERLQWIMDRRLVEQLLQHGDVLSAERPVDHFINFPEDTDVSAFCAAAQELGFAVPDELPAPADGMRSVPLQRMDAIEVDSIHATVMQLVELAAPYDGAHDGWGCPLVTEDDAH
jgi:regulator of RNase E activity RraB